MKTILMMALTSATLVVSGCATSHSHATVWEYKIVYGVSAQALVEKINKEAAEGWVLASVSGFDFAVMKRPKKAE